MEPAWFEKVLYPFQDEALAVAARVETGFYLTGGTALGRIHLRHRYSEDLDLFVNDDDRFQAWADRGDSRGRLGTVRSSGVGP